MPGPYSPADPRHYLGWARQTAKGTAVAPAYFARFQEALTFGHNPTTRQVREAGGGFGVVRTNKLMQASEVSAVVPAQPDLAAALFAHFLGADSVAGAADPYTHTITPSVAMNWLTVERNLADDLIERLIDAFITDIEVRIQKRDTGTELLLAATWQGLDAQRQASAATETYEADAPYTRSEATWTVDGAASTNVESCTLRLGWAYDEGMITDQVVRANTMKTIFTAEIELVQLFASQAEWDAYVATHYDGQPAGTATGETVYEGDLTVDYLRTGPPDRQLQIAFPRVHWANAVLSEADPSGTEATRVTRSGFAAIPTGGGDIVTVTAQTPTSAAYTA